MAGAPLKLVAGDTLFQARLPAAKGASLVDVRRVVLPKGLEVGSVGVRVFAFLAHTRSEIFRR